MRSSASPNPSSQTELKALDAVLANVGLARNPRGKHSGRRAARVAPVTPDELARPVPIPRIASNGVQWLPVSGWEKFSWLWAGFSTRKGGLTRAYCAEDAEGELNLGFTTHDDRETVLANRRLLVEAITGDPDIPLAAMRQFHSNLLVNAAAAGQGNAPQPGSAKSAGPATPPISKADALMTDRSGVLLAVQTADCIPVLVADRKRRAVAAFHAGWRGTVQRIVESGVGRMRLEFGSRPEDLIAAIGPGIGACCYAVGEEVFSAFDSQFLYAGELFREVYSADPVRAKYPMLFLTQRAPGHSSIGPSLHLDLVEANRRQLLAAGLKPRSIKIAGGCTSCHPQLFFSHRASQGRAGRMMAVIGVRGS